VPEENSGLPGWTGALNTLPLSKYHHMSVPLDPYETLRGVEGFHPKPVEQRKLWVDWQVYCGVRGEFSKYQEEYRVLGNAKWRAYVTEERYSQFKDKSYEENALEVSRTLIGLYE